MGRMQKRKMKQMHKAAKHEGKLARRQLKAMARAQKYNMA